MRREEEGRRGGGRTILLSWPEEEEANGWMQGSRTKMGEKDRRQPTDSTDRGGGGSG
jgi:hypothetical protein